MNKFYVNDQDQVARSHRVIIITVFRKNHNENETTVRLVAEHGGFGYTGAMIHVEVRFFGGQQLFTRRLSPEIERDLPQVTLPDGATVDELLKYLNIPFGDSVPRSSGHGRPLVVVNRRHQRDNAPLADGDQVQLMKTVVGG